MVEPFPILANYRGLVAADFRRFSKIYSEILIRLLPTARRVFFVPGAAEVADCFPDHPLLAEIITCFRAVQNGERAFAIHSQLLILPFMIRDGGRIIAIVDGADPVFLNKVSDDWLSQTRAAAEREFFLLKEARVDVQTGLLNLANLSSLLDTYSQTTGLHLILVALPPSRASFRYALRYSQKCSTLIVNFVQGNSVLHYLGQCTFALVLENSTASDKTEVECALVAYLKREGCHKVHIGSSFSRDFTGGSDAPTRGRYLLDEAWTALRHAAKRGPFNFCEYSLLAHPERHPLAPPEGNLVRRLSRQWLRADSFSLVHFRSTSEDHTARETVLPWVDQGVPFITASDVLVYLEGVNADAALAWARRLLFQIGETIPDARISAGVCGYPCSDFKKSETVFNCRKALLHAAFFGDSSAVVFDSVSLNISGDIYFGDGDLAKAVQEYRRGLKYDGKNVNLHNSLGVALAMMDKLGPAMQSFDHALALDRQNFMALYNLGLAEQARGRKEEAYGYLTKALHHYNDEDAGIGLLDDLQLQLGILAGDLGQHQTALGYLQAWHAMNEKNQQAGRALYHIGKALHGIGHDRQAMVELQRALQFNEFDDRAMNLLGGVYFTEREGDEIALALCRKSVELEPANLLYRCTLAEVQIHCKMMREARENLHRCLKSNKFRVKAQVLVGRSHVLEGMNRRAASWFAKALREETCPPSLHAEATRGLRDSAGA